MSKSITVTINLKIDASIDAMRACINGDFRHNLARTFVDATYHGQEVVIEFAQPGLVDWQVDWLERNSLIKQWTVKENNEPVKRGRGRPNLDKLTRTYTIDRRIAEYIDSLDEGKRSEFVNSWLNQHPFLIDTKNTTVFRSPVGEQLERETKS